MNRRLDICWLGIVGVKIDAWDTFVGVLRLCIDVTGLLFVVRPMFFYCLKNKSLRRLTFRHPNTGI